MDEKGKVPAPRRWWLAAILSVLLPGLGQIYNGQTKKGIVFFLLADVALVVSLLLILNVPSGAILVLAAVLSISVVVYIILDAALTARTTGRDYIRTGSVGSIYVLVICGLIVNPVIKTALKSYVVQAYKISNAAMVPSLQIGDFILVDKMYYFMRNPERGDAVVFDYPVEPDKAFIKRIAGVPGDVISIQAKQLYINGTPIFEKYTVHLDKEIIPPTNNKRDFFGPVVVPPDSYFVLGDNRDRSHDSRFWGFVGRSKIKGKAKVIYWSWDGNDKRVRWERFGNEIL